MTADSRFALLPALAATLFLFSGCSDDCTCPESDTGVAVVNPSPDSLNAAWTLDGPGDYSVMGAGDSPLVDLVPGDYSVVWAELPDWVKPPSEALVLAVGATVMFRGTYTVPESEPENVPIVKPDGTGDYPTIQAAVAGVPPLTTIILADGVFQGEGNRNIEIRDKVVSIISENGSAMTIIDCQDLARAFKVVDVPYCWLEGITVRNAFPVIAGGFGSGAGVYVENARCVVSDCVFENNLASWGSGVFCDDGGVVTVNDCTFRNSRAATGGAVASTWGGSVRLNGCVLINNRANRGGAAYSQGDSFKAVGCEFRSNETNSIASGNGGALCMIGVNNVEIRGCVFTRNTAAGAGGGLYVERSAFTVTRCTFWQNEAVDGDAGGISFQQCDHRHVSNTIIASSTSGAAMVGDVEMWPGCSDFWDNQGGDWVGCVAEAEEIGWGNFSLDPRFCDPWNSDFFLQADSPCLPSDICVGIGAFSAGCD